MKSWRLLLTLPNEKEEIELEECKIKRGIFQGDSFSPLVFCLAMAPLSRILKRAKVGFKINNELISHLKYIDDLKVYAKNKDEMKRCINLVEMFSRDIKMELGLDKCAIINVVKGEVNNKDFETKIPILTDDDEYKYLSIAETSDTLHNKMKEIEVKEFFKRVRAIGKAKLNAMNFTRAFNSFAVPVIRYGFGILSWTKTELQQLDRKTRKILTKAGYHHPKSNVHRLHAVREDGGRGIKSLLDTHEEECEKLATYLSLNVRKDPLTNLIKTMENERAPTKRVMRKRT